MIVSAPNVYAHMYQEATNQFTDEQRDQSLEWLRQGISSSADRTKEFVTWIKHKTEKYVQFFFSCRFANIPIEF